MKRIVPVTISILLMTGAVVMASGCTGNTEQELLVEYVKNYQNLSEAAADADLIVSGTITNTEKIRKDSKKSVSDVLFYSTHSLLHIERTVKGDYDPEITVFQHGASGFGCESENPIFEIGEQCFLFLEKRDNGLYYLIHPHCRFRIEENKVSSMDFVLPAGKANPPAGLQFHEIEIDEFITRVIEAARSEIIIPEEAPVIFMNLWKVMNGTNDELSIYEDGTVIYTKEWGLRMPRPDHPSMRAWRTGKLSEEEMNELALLMQNEEFVSLEGTYDFLKEEKPDVTEITTLATGDMQLKLHIDFAGVQKSIIANRFTSPDNGMTYPAMPYPLDEIYKALKDIAENKTGEIYREEI